MMRNACFVFLIALVFVAAPNAQAARFSGEYLLKVCSSDEDGKEVMKGGYVACQAYIAGIIDYHNLIHSMGTSPSVDFCVPEEAGLNTIQKQVRSYIFKNRHQHSAFTAAPAVALGLYAYYPCKK